MHILSEKLDSETAAEWQLTSVDGKMKTMDDLRQFLERRARALEASTLQPEMKREALGSKDIDIENKSEHCQSYQSTSMICSFCKQSQEEINKPSNEVYYLPHYCVFKEDSTTTKLCVVFDGSAKTSNGVSLNERLMVGPVVQNDLFTSLNRFRFKVVALSADIAKLYRQVELDSPDKDFHRLLWRNSKNEELQHLRMKRVTYSIASSAFHSTRCLKEVASQTQFE